MQIKKFEAPTIQEALDTIKRELGPEAIILQTKKHKKGFGIMNQASVEVTAAVSERSMIRKQVAEKRIEEGGRDQLRALPASQQADILEKSLNREVARRNRVQTAARTAASQGRQRYADIQDDVQDSVQAAPVRENERESAPAAGYTARSARMPIASSDAPVGANIQVQSLQEELGHLKRMFAELKSAQEIPQAPTGAVGRTLEGSLNTPALRDAHEQLVLNGVERKYALEILRKAAFELGEEGAEDPDQVIDQVAGELMRATGITSILKGIHPRPKVPGEQIELSTSGPRMFALVGPTGVGKTTTLAKIASEAILKRGLKVGLINLDGYKVAAFDQLATYAKILGAPFRSASNAADLSAALSDFRHLDLVLMDTTGRSPRDPENLQEMQLLLESIQGIQTLVVLAATTRDTELYDMSNRFSVFKPRALVVSKLDEATLFGSVYNLVRKSELPLAYFTTGQRVPEDIEEASRERVAALVMDL